MTAVAPESPAILWNAETGNLERNAILLRLLRLTLEGAVVSGLERGREGNWRERVNMADEDNLYLENLDEFVNDEDKIVC